MQPVIWTWYYATQKTLTIHFFDLIKLKSAIQESTLPILVDVLDWARIPDSFKEEIKRAHIVFYSPKHSGTDARLEHRR